MHNAEFLDSFKLPHTTELWGVFLTNTPEELKKLWSRGQIANTTHIVETTGLISVAGWHETCTLKESLHTCCSQILVSFHHQESTTTMDIDAIKVTLIVEVFKYFLLDPKYWSFFPDEDS